jgi:hypothetical protein
MANETTQNAATLGLGFHQFDGNVNVNDVIHQIGADFTVREDKLVRLPEDLFKQMMQGDAITIPTQYIIETHKATVHEGFDSTIGVVGRDYGTIQNNAAFDLLDLMCNSSVTDTPLKIVSAGMVNNYDPYIQAELPFNARVNGDPSDTKFYIFAHTSHDGTSALQIRFSPVRVICRNTFMANVSSKLGLTFKHSRYAAKRVDLSREANIEQVKEKITRLNFFAQDYIDQMNSFRLAKVTDTDINEYVLNLFVDDDKMKALARENNYNIDTVDEISTRTKNIITSFKNTIDSDDFGQDFARGTKLNLFNATTRYLTHEASYGSMNDDDATKATKRFNSMLNGTANKRMEKAFALLAA